MGKGDSVSRRRRWNRVAGTLRRSVDERDRHLSTDDNDDDDEEIPEDCAFDSDDERKYGSFFASEAADGDDDDDDDDDGSDEGETSQDDSDDDGGDDGKYMLNLLEKIDDDSKEKGRPEKKPLAASTAVAAAAASHVKESEFASSVVPRAGLTLDTLMDGLLRDDAGAEYSSLQKTMKGVAKGQPTTAPLSKAVSDRARRKVHYRDKSKDVSLWLDAVRRNREAESLDFRPKQKLLEVTRDVLVDKFVPSTDFERELQAALEDAGQRDEETMLRREEEALFRDDLGANEITADEYRKRRGQLAKMRALMFYHEQKRHHMKKIKSKKYRRIRKRQRERQREAEVDAQVQEDPVLARELEEKDEMDRMRERMTLAHKNTSKWAKRVLRRGKNVDADTRRALSAQLRRGDDLLQRMKSTTRAYQDDDSEDSDEDLAETARKVLAETEKEAEEPVRGQGLFKLAFMQRGVERQREQAKEEARRLLQELEEDEDEDQGGDFAEGPDDRDTKEDNEHEDTSAQKRKKVKVASKEEMKRVLKDGQLVASSLKFGNSDSLAVSGGIDVDMGQLEAVSVEQKSTGKPAAKATVSEHSAALPEPAASVQTTATVIQQAVPATTGEGQADKARAPTAHAAGMESNPWLTADGGSCAPESAAADARSAGLPRARRGSRGMVDIERAADLLEVRENGRARTKGRDGDPGTTSERGDKGAPTATAMATATTGKEITDMTQEELVQKAFAGISEKEAEEEFAKEKEAVREQEDATTTTGVNTNKKRKAEDMTTVAGWGSWAGKGAPPPKPPSKLPKRLRPPEKKKIPPRKRQDEKKPHVIISERRMKKLADRHMVADIPHPYRSREEYERAVSGGVGREWNATGGFRNLTRPEVLTRPGKIIQPLSQRAKHARPAAKF